MLLCYCVKGRKPLLAEPYDQLMLMVVDKLSIIGSIAVTIVLGTIYGTRILNNSIEYVKKVLVIVEQKFGMSYHSSLNCCNL